MCAEGAAPSRCSKCSGSCSWSLHLVAEFKENIVAVAASAAAAATAARAAAAAAPLAAAGSEVTAAVSLVESFAADNFCCFCLLLNADVV